MPTRTASQAKTAPSSRAGRKRTAPAAEPRLSRTRRPTDLSPADWQTALRRQFGREQHFGLENLGSDPVFSDFRVHNPATGGRWRVTIRGAALGQNLCTCPDFATNWVPEPVLKNGGYYPAWYGSDTPESIMAAIRKGGWAKRKITTPIGKWKD